MLRDIMNLQSLHNTPYIAFCFDHGVSLRCANYPKYKSSRRDKIRSPEEQAAYEELRFQIRMLKTDYLKSVGFQNIFFQKGYEADDIIAGLCQGLHKNQEAIIVSADHDMYQLLSDNVSIWNPNQKEMMTKHRFSQEWGIEPDLWIDVKSIAGCNSDEIDGIDGVGEKTAAKFLTGSLKEKTKAFRAIVAGNAIWNRNRQLVKLPYPGLKNHVLMVDAASPTKWDQLAKRLGIRSLKHAPPMKEGFGLS